MRTLLDFTLLDHPSFFKKKAETASMKILLNENQSFICNDQQWVIPFIQFLSDKESYKIVPIDYSLCFTDIDSVQTIMKSIYVNCIQTESITQSLIKFAKYFTTINLKFANKDNHQSFYFEISPKNINQVITEIFSFIKQGSNHFIFLHTNVSKVINSTLLKKIIANLKNLNKNIIISSYLQKDNKEKAIFLSNFSNLETIILTKSFLKKELISEPTDINEIITFLDYSHPLIEQLLPATKSVKDLKKYIQMTYSVEFINQFNKLTNNQQKALLIIIELSGNNVFNGATTNKYDIQKSSLERALESLLESNIVRKDNSTYKISNPLFKYWIQSLSH